MEEKIKELVQISRYFGQNPDYILAGGGNTSYKNDDQIWVKASGTSLATIEADGFVCLDRQKMKAITQKQYSENSARREEEVKADLNQAILYPKDRRPSVEVSMHEIIRYPFVVHTHPTLVNGLLCAQNSRSEVERLFGREVVYVGYTDPGYVLFKAVSVALSNFRKEYGTEPKIIFLENHGVFVAADTCDEIVDIYASMERTLEAVVHKPPLGENRPFNNLDVCDSLKAHCGMSLVSVLTVSDRLTDVFVANEQAFSEVSRPFTPDNIVYCKSDYLFVSNRDSLTEYVIGFFKNHGYYPRVMPFRGWVCWLLKRVRSRPVL